MKFIKYILIVAIIAGLGYVGYNIFTGGQIIFYTNKITADAMWEYVNAAYPEFGYTKDNLADEDEETGLFTCQFDELTTGNPIVLFATIDAQTIYDPVRDDTYLDESGLMAFSQEVLIASNNSVEFAFGIHRTLEDVNIANIDLVLNINEPVAAFTNPDSETAQNYMADTFVGYYSQFLDRFPEDVKHVKTLEINYTQVLETGETSDTMYTLEMEGKSFINKADIMAAEIKN